MSKQWQTSNQQYGSQVGRSASQPRPRVGRSTLDFLEAQEGGRFLHEQEKIAQRERHGLFTQPVGLAPGDQYRDSKPEPVPKRMEVNQRLQQKVGPELFSRLSSTNIGDQYRDPHKAGQLYLKEKTDMSIHPQPFAAGSRQKLVKHSEFEHRKEYDDKQYHTRDAQGNILTGPKSILTNNMKKGQGSSTVGHLFSQYPYAGYPEDDQRRKNWEEKLLHKARIPEPFRGGSNPSATFTADHAVYQANEPYRQRNEDEQFRGKSVGGWKYNNPGRRGHNATFTAFPQYIEQGEAPRQPRKQEPVWIPNFNGTSKDANEALSRPTPAPSQLLLNQLRHAV